MEELADRDLSIGAQFSNATGGTITRLDISFDGELWYTGPQAKVGEPDTLTFDFSTDATSVLDGAATWTPVAELNFTAPSDNRSQFTFFDGNLDENRVAGISHIITGLNIAVGSTFFIRWSNSASHAVGIDDVSVTASSGGGPVSQEPAITDVTFDGADVTLTWESLPGRFYIVEASRDLEADAWIEIDDGVPSGGVSTTLVFPEGALVLPVDPAAEDTLLFRVIDDGPAAP